MTISDIGYGIQNTDLTPTGDAGVAFKASFTAIVTQFDALVAADALLAPLTNAVLVTPNLGTPSAGVMTNVTGTAAGLTAGAVSTITGLAPDTATTAAAQPNITSLGTLTTLSVDNITIDGNTISSTAGVDLNITPLAGQQIVLDGAVTIDADQVTGATFKSFTNDIFADHVHEQFRNETGSTLTIGDVVYLSGYSVGQELATVSIANATSSATMPCVGILDEATLANNANGDFVEVGTVTGMDTSAWSVGDALYVSTVGTSGNTLTSTKPTGTALIQKVATVLRSHPTLGVIEVFGAGRTNDLPNIANTKIWIGDASGVPQEFALSGDVTMAAGGVTTIAVDAVDIPMLSATGTADATTFLRGDNTWTTPTGSGDVSKVGTPVNDQVGVWTGDGTIEGLTTFTCDLSGNVTAASFIGPLTGNADTVTTNANLTGHIVSVGNASSLGSFTKSELSTAVSDGTPLYVGDVTSNATHTGDVTGDTVLTIAVDAVDIPMLSATGTADATTFLRGDNTWTTPSGSGDVSKVGVPVNDQVGVWTGDGTIEGLTTFTCDASGNVTATSFIGPLTGNADTVTTNADLTGAITSTGNASSLGSFTKAQLNTAISDDTPMYDLVDDTSPQLGSHLDITGWNIVTTAAANIKLAPDTTGDVILGTMRFDADQVMAVGLDNYVLTYDNATGKISLEAAAGGGSGDVVGPASATDNAIARYDTTTGKLIQDSLVTINDAGDIISSGVIRNSTDNDCRIEVAASNFAWYDNFGSYEVSINNVGIAQRSDRYVGWTTGSPGAAVDTALYRDGIGKLGQRSGTTAQEFAVYETEDTSLTNYSRLATKYNATSLMFEIEEERAGTSTTHRGTHLKKVNEVLFTERADHVSTPTAGEGYLWVKNSVPSALFFTADDGTDTDLTAASSGDMVLASAQTNTGVKTFNDTTMKLRNVANTFDGYFVNTNTADRIYTLQDAAGTIAFTSDITGTNSGTNTGDQTITLTGDVTGTGTGSFATTIAVDAVDIPMLSATGTADATTFLRGDNTWTTPAGSGDVSKVGTPLNDQVGVWTGDGTIEGLTTFTCDLSGNVTAASFIGPLTGNADTVTTITGLAPDTATTAASQPNITSVGTLTTLAVDNITIDGNTISSTAGVDLNITPLAGQQLVLDGTVILDAGVITGATSITSTTFVGSLTGQADTVATNANLTGAITSTGNASSLGSFTSAALNTAISDATLTGNNTGDQTVTGQQTIWMPAGAMVSRTTLGAAAGSVETTTNKVMIITKDFDATADEFVQFSVLMPKGWDEGTLIFQPVWSHAATATNFGVAWAMQAVAFANDDAADTAFGTAIVVTDTGGTTDDVYIGAESAALTVAGTPGAEEWVVFQMFRDVSDAFDDMAIDARLQGVKIHYTTDAAVDD